MVQGDKKVDLSVFSANKVVPKFVPSMAGKKVDYDGPNCFGAALGIFGTHLVENEARYYVEQDYNRTTYEQLKPGDLVVFGDFNHMALFLGEEAGEKMVFHKRGWKRQAPYEVVPLESSMGLAAGSYYEHVIDKFDRIGKEAQYGFEYEKQYYTPISDASKPQPTQNSASEPLIQFHLLRFYALAGVEFEKTATLNMMSSAAAYIVNAANGAGDHNNGGPLPEVVTKGVLRLDSMKQQVDMLAGQRETKDDLGLYLNSSALRSEVILYAISQGVLPSQLESVVDEAIKKYQTSVGSRLSMSGSSYTGMVMGGEIYDVVKNKVFEHAAMMVKGEGVDLETMVTPLEVMSDPAILLEDMKKMQPGTKIVLKPLAPDVFQEGAKLLFSEVSKDHPQKAVLTTAQIEQFKKVSKTYKELKLEISKAAERK